MNITSTTIRDILFHAYDCVARMGDAELEIWQATIEAERNRRSTAPPSQAERQSHERTSASMPIAMAPTMPSSTMPSSSSMPVAVAVHDMPEERSSMPPRPTGMYRVSAGRTSSAPPQRLTVEALQDAIYEREGFRVEILGVGRDTFLRPFAFERRMRSDCTIQQWRAIRFARMYPGIDVRVFLADGHEARGTHLIETVRNSYQTVEEQPATGTHA